MTPTPDNTLLVAYGMTGALMLGAGLYLFYRFWRNGFTHHVWRWFVGATSGVFLALAVQYAVRFWARWEFVYRGQPAHQSWQYVAPHFLVAVAVVVWLYVFLDAGKQMEGEDA